MPNAGTKNQPQEQIGGSLEKPVKPGGGTSFTDPAQYSYQKVSRFF